MNFSSQSVKLAIKSSPGNPVRKTFTGPVAITGPRQAKFTFSSESVDRDDDVIKQSGIDLSHFVKSPVIFYNHDHDVPIARCVSIGLEDGNLCGVIEFASADNPIVGAKAEGIFQLCRDGFLSTTSIGFIPKTIADPQGARLATEGCDVMSCELVEISVVGIASNRDAMIQQVSGEPEAETPPALTAAPTKHYRAARLKRVLAALD